MVLKRVIEEMQAPRDKESYLSKRNEPEDHKSKETPSTIPPNAMQTFSP
jgi:hypothetical protein